METVVPLKYVSNYLRALHIALINCEILILTWSVNCVIKDRLHREADPNTNLGVVGIFNPINATFKITCRKFYVPVITLSVQEDNKLFEQLKIGFKRTIKWDKYISKMSNQTKNDNLNYLIHPSFTNIYFQ